MAGAKYMISLILAIHTVNGINASPYLGKLVGKQVSIKVYFLIDQDKFFI